MLDHDAYLARSPENFRPLLEQLRAQLSAALPDADEIMKYDMPGFQVGGSVVAGYSAFSRQCGLYLPPAPGVPERFRSVISAGAAADTHGP